ncbi:transposase family protein [Paenibacillus residui]|uniref:Transposase family protein n=1 Tax=Paenibacillus residui TaxID=629724 RepID=A0ABW3D6M5_9BACL
MKDFILGLSEFIVLEDIQENEKDMLIIVETKSPPLSCPHCGRRTKLYKHGSRIQIILDLPIRLKRVGLQLNRKRYKCRECGSTFWERLSSVEEKRSMTKRLLKSIEEQSLFKPFTEVAESVGVDEKTVRNIFKNCAVLKKREYHY